MTQPPPSSPHPGYPPPGYAPAPPGGYAVPQYPQPLYPPGPTGPGGARLAEFGDRFLAYLLDSLIVGAILLIPTVALMVAFITMSLSSIDPVPPGQPPNFGYFPLFAIGFFFIALGINALATYLYQVSYQMRNGQTVGKRVMKLRIVDAETGAPMTVSAARKRWAMQLLFGILGVVSYLDGLWQLWDPQKQTLHDKVARTVVVKVPA